MSLSSIGLIALLIGCAYYWLQSRELKDYAFKAAVKHCKALDLDVLDQAVALKGLSLQRNARGAMAIQRRYGFDFTSTGEDRYQGEVIMLGRFIDTVKLAPHRLN